MTSILPTGIGRTAADTPASAAGSGWWSAGADGRTRAGPAALLEALRDVDRPLLLVEGPDGPAVAEGGIARIGPADGLSGSPLRLLAHVPALPPQHLGSAAFRADHGVRFAYVAGAMANGIASTELVTAMSRGGMLGFFGAAGLPVERVEAALDRLAADCGDGPRGANLIHSPNEPGLEQAIADLYVRRGVRTVSASAYMGLTLPLVRYRFAGIHLLPDGRIVAPNRVLAKVSRVEVATRFFSPPPGDLLDELVRRGHLTREQAGWAARLPVAQDLTAEADSGGHTDNRPALTLLPTMRTLRDRLQAEHGYDEPLRVGAAGGIATPLSVSAAFALGADYVVTGSINQACVEAGTSDKVRTMLAQAAQADVCMAPAADMFEMGVRVQVLKRGTLFAMRGAKLYELYRTRESLDDLTPAERSDLEKKIFRTDLDSVWQDCRRYFAEHDPTQIARAETDPKHRMALVFRWYLGQSSHWANSGDAARQVDYQVWCGPAMGAFNQWAAGTQLEDRKERRVMTVARSLLYGAAVQTRAAALRTQGVTPPASDALDRPPSAAELEERLG